LTYPFLNAIVIMGLKQMKYEQFDLDKFYSSESISEWKQIIGEELHYHFGYFRGSEDLETGLRQTVKNFYPYITPGSRILDIGCGWGGPAKMLIAERNCSVTGITSSTAQIEYCQHQGLNVWQQNLEQEPDEISGEYDAIFSLEMISHIRNKARLLRRLRSRASRLILSESCAADNYSGDRTTFGGSIVLCTVSELVRAVEDAGWKIQSMQDRRFNSLRTIVLWKQNLDRIYGDSEPPGQLSSLRSLVNAALPSPINWCHSFPLIDIVAN
jgi:cyclopropane fatty-acyl-phospholipid synthase-like methyltransferase